MRPLKDIHIGDIYKRPGWTVEWVVVDKNDNEKMVEIEPTEPLPGHLSRSIWKRNTYSLFNYRVYNAEQGEKMKNEKINRFLGKDAVEEYTEDSPKGITQDRLEEIYNNYYSGNVDNFKGSFKTINEFAQFITYMIEMGTDLREVQRMVQLLV